MKSEMRRCIKPTLKLSHFLEAEGREGSQIKVAQNGLKHILVLEFFEIR